MSSDRASSTEATESNEEVLAQEFRPLVVAFATRSEDNAMDSSDGSDDDSPEIEPFIDRRAKQKRRAGSRHPKPQEVSGRQGAQIAYHLVEATAPCGCGTHGSGWHRSQYKHCLPGLLAH